MAPVGVAPARRVMQASAPYRLDILRISLGIIMILSVSRIHQRYSFLAAIRPGLLFTLIALVVAFLSPKVLGHRAWMRRWPALTVAAITIVTLGSIYFGISQGGAFLFFSDIYWKVLVACFLMMAAIRGPRDLWAFVWAYVVGTAILAFMALFVFKMVQEHNGVTRLSNLDTWDANDVCVLMLIGLPLCLLLIRTSKLVGKVFALVTLVGVGCVIARSGSRGGFLGLSAVLFAYLLSMKGTAKVRGVGVVTVVAIALSAAAPEGYWKQMSTITSAKEDYNWDALQGRRQLAIRGIGYMMSYPVFGLGVGNFGRAEGTISSFAGEHGTRWSAAHNTYVQAGSELGIPGFLLFDGMVLATIIVPWRLRRRIPVAWEKGDWEERFLFNTALFLPLAAVGFAVPAYFVSFAYTDPPYMVAAMVSGLIACVEVQLRQDTGARHGPTLRTGAVTPPRSWGTASAPRGPRRELLWARRSTPNNVNANKAE